MRVSKQPLLAAYQHPPVAANGIRDVIGNTPLVRLGRYVDERNLNLYAKLECSNPGGSAKDRPARQMIEDAIRNGKINEKTKVVESSSGNMGIGLAQICRHYDIPFICIVDPNAQSQNIAIMKALGAEVRVVTEKVNGDFLTARLDAVKTMIDECKDYYWPNQYCNLQNPLSHQLGTIHEIDQVLGAQLDYLFVAASSTGTARGCQEYLRTHGRKAKVVVVDAEGSVLFGGVPKRRFIPGLGAGRIPELAQQQQFHAVKRVTDLECVVGCRRMAEREAMLVGGSAGGVLEAIRSMQDELRGSTIAAVLHDSGTRYLDTVFNDQWVEEKLGATSDELRTLANHTPCRQATEAVA